MQVAATGDGLTCRAKPLISRAHDPCQMHGPLKTPTLPAPALLARSGLRSAPLAVKPAAAPNPHPRSSTKLPALLSPPPLTMQWMAPHTCCPIAGISALDFGLPPIFYAADAVMAVSALWIGLSHSSRALAPIRASTVTSKYASLFIMGGWHHINSTHTVLKRTKCRR